MWRHRGLDNETAIKEKAALLVSRDTARAMSQENLEVVRNYFKVWNAGDMEGV